MYNQPVFTAIRMEENKVSKIDLIKQRLAAVPAVIWLTTLACAIVIAATVTALCLHRNNNDTDSTPTDTEYYGADIDTPSDSAYPPADSEEDADESNGNTSGTGTSGADATDAEATSPDSESDTETEKEADTEGNGNLPEIVLGELTVKGHYTPSDDALDALYKALDDYGHEVGFTAIDIDTGMTLSYNAKTKYESASVIKAAYVYYVCTLIDKGEASLDDVIVYTEADAVHKNGTIGKSEFGTEYTLRDVIKYTVKKSDNEGYYMLVRTFGRSGYDEFIKSLGANSCVISSSRWPKITASDFALLWREIYDYGNETATGEWLYNLFLNVDYKHFFKDALSVKTANKAGWNDESYNDSGVVYGDRTYIFVLLADASYYDSSTKLYNKIVEAVNGLISEYAAVIYGTGSETTVPEPETTAPEPETTAPEPETTAPKPETTAPEPETTAPKPETTAPEPETTAPEPETTAPKPETTAPEPETTAPEPETTAPKPETTTPEPETTAPEPETTTPEPETTAPEPETTAPEPETTAPEPETTTPEPETTAPEENTFPVAMTDEQYQKLITEAEKYLGYKYVWGGSTPATSFDCSGFVSYVVNHCGNGWSIGRRTSKTIYSICTTVSKSEVRPGDLVFFTGTYNTKGISHVGFYVGDGMMLHCGDPISYVSIETEYWQEHFYCFGRFNFLT